MFENEYELKDIYNENYWSDDFVEINYMSAKIILNILLNHYNINSVVDIGCGIGAWLKASIELGINDIKGVDCNEISEDKLLVPRKYVYVDNLETHSNLNNKKYDLAISVEVAEHLNNSISEKFVQMLTSYSDVVLFSAAIPYQVGEHHINCQAPKFWFDLFKKSGYACFDFRYELMNIEEKLAPYYAQNILLFVHNSISNNFTFFKETLKPIFFYHPSFVYKIVDDNKVLCESMDEKIEKFKLESSWFQLFSISNNRSFLRITLFGIKIVFKLNEENIAKILSLIPLKKWRYKFLERVETRPDQTRPDQTRPNYHICIDYICNYNNTKYKKLQPIF